MRGPRGWRDAPETGDPWGAQPLTGATCRGPRPGLTEAPSGLSLPPCCGFLDRPGAGIPFTGHAFSTRLHGSGINLRLRIPHPVSLLLLLLFGLGGCASAPAPAPAVAPGPEAHSPANDLRLARLWQERTDPASASDFSIGPGDLLEISVPGLVELEKHTSRVSSEGTISLPLLGTIPAGGRTEDELAEDIRLRLQASVMYDPSVVVFLAESRHRSIGVTGAVYKPGFYDAASQRDTILDLISLAGGTTETAASRALLIPAARTSGSPGIAPAALETTSPEPLRRSDAIAIEFDNATHAGHPSYLNLPVRPGDVIVIPERGHVLVKGWVHQPGSYEISAGLTVLGAVTAAGGMRYAADKSAVELIRKQDDGQLISHRFDLRRLQSGAEADVPVQSGDVIDISHSTPKLIAFSFVDFLTRVFSLGARL